jgi:hypothetical protein
MKPITTARNKYTGKLYKFVRKQKGSETELEYYYAKDINVTVGLDSNNRMSIRCDEPLALGFILKDIKDSIGNLILSDTAWQISAVEPVLNAFNTLDSYRMRAIKYEGII